MLILQRQLGGVVDFGEREYQFFMVNLPINSPEGEVVLTSS